MLPAESVRAIERPSTKRQSILRLTTLTVTYADPFRLSGFDGELPAGHYQLLIEEELLQGISFEAYRRTGAYLSVIRHRGVQQQWSLAGPDLDYALAHADVPTR